ncbi:MAG TPA: hypothetical protein VGV59_02280 [Pyrinomonadaceae bacterium]|nr:hypothetical protein [Pyrinomonadaceae bacterium]
MADTKTNTDADRFASGTGATARHEAEGDDMKPGETAREGSRTYAGDTGEAEAATAAHAEGTRGAVGEMDFTGAPAGGQTGAGETRGGGPGGGAHASGGVGPSDGGQG